ncbi:MAG TPA: PorV/PorQ family protein, partial [Bacteroidales bacterium]|nr:PorV/PorQ family protein [Bacteroidales bacterium]
VAIFYKHDFKINKRDSRIAFGMDISNLGARISYSELGYRAFLPTNLRIGPSFTYNIDDFNAITVAFDLNKLLVPTPPLYTYDSITEEYVIAKGMDPSRDVVNALFTSFWDAPGGFKEELHEVIFSGGIEYDYSRQFFIRAGYFNEHKTKGNRKFATFGVGVRYNIFDLSFSYLVPFEQHHPLENVLRFTMTFNFFKPQNKPK